MRFFERLDLQVNQLYRTAKHMVSPRHLKLGSKTSIKQLKENWPILFVSTWSISPILNYLTGKDNLSYSILAGLALAATPIAITASTLGLGFFRGIRAPKEAINTEAILVTSLLYIPIPFV